MICNAKQIPVKDLMPSQREIDVEKVFEYIFTEEDFDRFFGKSVLLGDSPLVTFGGKYIVDGHHRWANIFILNPKAKVEVLDFEPEDKSEGIEEFIERFDTADTSEREMEQDLYKCSDDDLKKYIGSGISNDCVDGLLKNGCIKEKEPAGSYDPEASQAIQYLLKNAIELRDKHKPEKDAPKRMEMPQLVEQSSTESIDTLIKALLEI